MFCCITNFCTWFLACGWFSIECYTCLVLNVCRKLMRVTRNVWNKQTREGPSLEGTIIHKAVYILIDGSVLKNVMKRLKNIDSELKEIETMIIIFTLLSFGNIFINFSNNKFHLNLVLDNETWNLRLRLKYVAFNITYINDFLINNICT